MEYELQDFDGRLIEVGTPVRIFDFDPTHPDFAVAPDAYVGRVVEIDEWEADVDEDGRSISITPRVVVEWRDGSRDRCPSSEWEFDGPWDEREPVLGKVEDLAVIGAPRVGHVRLRGGSAVR